MINWTVQHIRIIKPFQVHKQIRWLICLLLALSTYSGFSQENSSQLNDTLKLQYPLSNELRFPFSNSGVYSPLYLNNPSNIKQSVIYDPSQNRFIFTETIGKFNYRPPASMSIDQYFNYVNQTSIRDYWYQKSRETQAVQKPSLLAPINLGETFDKVFGTDVINITPQGSAELIFGYNMSRNDNPALSEKNRRNGSFLFKEKIQMNVTGSIGDKMQLGINYNTEASFDFENKTKLEYTGKEDEIIKKIEAGNVTFSLPGNLITGSQSLFGLKTDLQFGKLYVSTVFSHQRGQSQVIEVKGGAQVSDFEVDAVDYDANRHFFLSHFFRDNYNTWLKSLPYVNSGVRIEQIEVWITNKTSDFNNDTRNILALMDLGEGYGPDGLPNFFGNIDFILPEATINAPAGNEQNQLYRTITQDYAGFRTFNQISGILASLETSADFYNGIDFEKVENARKLNEREYTINRELGYISLNSSLRSDEVLAVAYVYTYQGKTYRVGELSTDGVSAPNTLVVKMIKGTSLTPKHGTWDLMMKNVYAIGAFQVSAQDFILDIMYRKDETGVPVNYIADNQADSSFNRKILLKVLEMDNLDSRNEPIPDGRFDFIEGTTITPRNGKIFFTQVEPFGANLRQTITGGDPVKDPVADKYVFEELYDSTQTKARQISSKNKFFISGSYQSSSSSEIQLNAMNIPQGSVKVSSGGLALVEGQDYTVDYTLGRVRILNQGLIESGAPIKVSLESNALFNLQTKTLIGTHLEYKFSDNFNIGATLMNLTERPLTQKVNIGNEPISNTIWGFNTSYRTESQFITNLIDKLPLIETKEISSLTFDAEFAHLIPGQAKVIGEGGVAYIDDFEGTETPVELKTIQSWFLSSAPRRFDYSGNLNDLRYGYNRAKLAWYSIDPLFTRNESRTPDNITEEEQNSQFVREILETEIFKNRESGTGFDNTLVVMNLAYYPEERGPYNFDPSISFDGRLSNPENRWGGIMREIQTNDFETSNIEYIEFWLMDPFVLDSLHEGGDLYINLGEISEDVLKDSRKSFENGLPTTDTILRVDTNTVWGRVPTVQAIVNSFDADPDNRAMQDVGLDGLNDEQEREKFSTYINGLVPGSPAYQSAYEDPSNDNFRYFLSSDYDTAGVISRYKDYNDMEGNSPTNQQSGGEFAAATTLPNTEDLNGDNTLNETESYYEYHVPLKPDVMDFDNSYITEIVRGKDVNWYQFRIPIGDFNSKFGNIEDFKSIRFMRMYLTGFKKPIILRFAELRLVRSEWRKYDNSLIQGGPSVTDQYEGTSFEITSVNIEENAAKEPVNYILPPGIDRVVDPNQPQVAQLNEQSVVYRVRNLADGDARGAYKNMNLDLRQYKKLKMFIHAEALIGETLNDYEMTAFIRLGSDQTDNYYEYEVPLAVTPQGVYNDSERRLVWPDENLVEINLEGLVDLKVERDKAIRDNPDLYNITKVYKKKAGKNLIRIKGTPSLSNIRTILIGIRNASDVDNDYPNDGMLKSAEIWFNELRLTDFDNDGGWAANARTQMRLADLGTVSIAGSTSKPGFGSIEQKVDERSKEEINQVDVSSNIELGKLLPEKTKVSVPLYVGVSKTTINPEYAPNQPDRMLKDALDEAETKEEKKEIKELAQDVVKRKSINLTNVRVNQDFEKFRLLSPSNFSFTVGYSKTEAHSYEVERNNTIRYGLNFNYVYNARPKSITPFGKAKGLSSPYLRFIKDFNFSLMPSRLSFRTDFDRYYNEIKMRNVYEDREILIDSTVSKDFVWTKEYEISWDLTRSLRFDFSVFNQSRIEEQQGAYDWFRKGDNREWSKSVWKSIGEGGRAVRYSHSFNATYNVPLNKFPILNWTSLSFRYNSTFMWNEGPVYEDSRSLGNTISNSNTLQANSSLSLSVLYNKVKFINRINSKYSGTAASRAKTEKRYKTVDYSRESIALRANTTRNISHKLNTRDVEVTLTDREGKAVEAAVQVIDENKISITADTNYSGIDVRVTGEVEAGENPLVFIAENTIRILTGLKNVTLSYSKTGATNLMGYMPTPNIIGYNNGDDYGGAPGFPFLFGAQDPGFVREAAEKGWLTKNSAFNSPFTMNETENVSIRGTFEPVRGFRIELSGTRTFTKSVNEYFYYSDTVSTSGGFYFDNRMKYGSFSISIISIGSAFEKISSDNGYKSVYFERFKEYRKVISHRLYARRLEQSGNEYQGSIQQEVEPGYADGYGSTSPEVIIPAFLASYTNKDPDNISLSTFPGYLSIMPNWRVTFDGLSRIAFLQQFLRSADITHSYRSTYNINSYNTNFGFVADETDGLGYIRDIQNNFIPELQINTVAIREELNPLIAIDIAWVNSLSTRLEYRKSRILALSLSNNQLTESLNNDLIIGAGYRFDAVPVKIGERTFESDLNLRFDLAIRDNKTIIRYLAQTETYEVDQITAGERYFKIEFTADYLLSPRFNLRLFFDRTLNKPHTSRSFLRVDTNVGFSLRFTLTQ